MEETEDLERNKNLYRQLVKKITWEEKLWLLDCNGDYEVYKKRLRFLAKKYAVLSPKK